MWDQEFQTGASVSVTGTLVESPGKGQALEVQGREVELIGALKKENPLQKKAHTLEFLRTQLSP